MLARYATHSRCVNLSGVALVLHFLNQPVSSCSFQETAEILKAGGKAHWVSPRKDKIQAKGKGELETFFIDIKKQSSGSQTSARSAASYEDSVQLDMPHLQKPLCNAAGTDMTLQVNVPPQLKRRVHWNTDILIRMLQQIVARRDAETEHQKALGEKANSGRKLLDLNDAQFLDDVEGSANSTTAMEEVAEVITLPDYNPEAAKYEKNSWEVVLPPAVIKQLQEYVTVVASLYHHDNPFHNVSPAGLACPTDC